MAQHHDLGITGEQMAKAFLMQKGYRILEENWAYGHLEIDIIAHKDTTLVFVEVKTRTSSGFGMPEEFVKRPKQLRMAKAAGAYIQRMDYQGEIRFDIMAILFTGTSPVINHIEDAFWPQ